MVRRSWLLTGLGLALLLASPAGAWALKRPVGAQVRPTAFASCASLVSYAKAHYAVTHGLPEPPIEPVAVTTSTATPGAKSAAGTAAAPSAASPADTGGSTPSYSTTNNQEAGVDEPDIAKTDGSTIFTIAQGKLEAVSVGGAAPHLAGTLDLGANGSNAQLLLSGNRLLVISTPPFAVPVINPVAASLRASPYWAYGAQTVITEVDVHDPSAMAVTQTMTVDGRFVDARQSGTSARIVISSAPHAIARAAARHRCAGMGSDLEVRRRTHRSPLHPPDRLVRRHSPARAVLGARDAQHRDGELHQGPSGGPVDLADGRCADRLRIAVEPLRRHADSG